jgi:DNA polymerase I-like protein with 3'-5' exonuclease and polymerase domains
MNSWQLFTDIVSPAQLVLHRAEVGGVKCDVEARDELRKDVKKELRNLTGRIQRSVQELHDRRLARVEEAIGGLEDEKILVYDTVDRRCSNHPDYRGRTRRLQCGDCAAVYRSTSAIEARRASKDYTQRIAKGRQVIKRIGPRFKISSDQAWRWLLFDKLALNLKPAPGTRTKKRKEPKVNAKSIEKLARRYPDVEILRLKTQADQAAYRLSVTLAAKADDQGFVHPVYSLAKTNTGRVASGTSDVEPGKKRKSSAGNFQNIPERDRVVYVADTPNQRLVAADWKNIEALVVAWLARDEEMVRIILDPEGDIHTDNALMLAEAIGVKLKREDARRVPFPYDPQKKSFRQNGKITHKWNYGMRERRMRDDYGIPLNICKRLKDAYFERWPLIKRWQDETEREVNDTGMLTTPFGRTFRFHNWKRRDGKWVTADLEEALADGPQSIVGDMCKARLPVVEYLYADVGGRFLTTTHDSFLGSVPTDAAPMTAVKLRQLLEIPWKQMPRLHPGTMTQGGLFWCPAEPAVGYNWGKYDPDKNPEGLREV